MQPTKETETILNLLPIVKTGESSKYDVWYVKPDTSFFNQTRLRVGAINEHYCMLITICTRRQLCLYVFNKKLSWNGNTKCVRPGDTYKLSGHIKNVPSASPFRKERILGGVPSDPRGIILRRNLFAPDLASDSEITI